MLSAKGTGRGKVVHMSAGEDGTRVLPPSAPEPAAGPWGGLVGLGVGKNYPVRGIMCPVQKALGEGLCAPARMEGGSSPPPLRSRRLDHGEALSDWMSEKMTLGVG